MSRWGLLAIALLALASPPAAGSDGPTAVRALIERMARAGRAEARVVVTTQSGAEAAASRRGTLALEPPDRLRLDYEDGERLATRSDGGEWLQPSLKQMLTLTPAQARRATVLWKALHGGSRGWAERSLGAGRWRLTVAEDQETPESLLVTVGTGRLPARIETRVGDVRWTIRLVRWRFTAAKGPEAFTLHAPAGYESIPMP